MTTRYAAVQASTVVTLARRPRTTIEVVPSATTSWRPPALVYLAGLTSPHSRRAMHGGLRRVLAVLGSDLDVAIFPWEKMRYAEVVAARAALLAAGHGPSAVNGSLNALRGVLREAFALELYSAEDYARVRTVKGVKSQRLPAGRDVPEGELRDLFEACDRSTATGVRDAALLAVLRVTGMRRAELCHARLEDLDLGAGTVKVLGKGNKERLGHLGEALVDVKAWLEVRGRAPGPLFLSWSTRASEFRPEGLTESGVYGVLKRIAARAGVPHLSPHDLRRTVVGDLLDAGVDAVTVQKLVGHASPTTTARYDRRGERVRRDAVAKIKVPR